MTQTSPTPKADPRQTAQRILANLHVADRPRMYRCGVCRDVGWVEYGEGTPWESPSGQRHHAPAPETTHAGVVKRCPGPRSSGCPWERHKRAEAIQRAAQTRTGEAPDESEAKFS